MKQVQGQNNKVIDFVETKEEPVLIKEKIYRIVNIDESNFVQIDKLGQYNAPEKMLEHALTDEKPKYDKLGDIISENDMIFQPKVLAPDTVRLTLSGQNKTQLIQ